MINISKILKDFTKDLKTVYRADKEEQGFENLESMEEKWRSKYGYMFTSWKNNWWELSTMFSYPEEIRKMIYTTNSIEWFNRGLRKYTKIKTIFPTDQSLEKSLYLAMKNMTKKWIGSVRNWNPILNQFKIFFKERI
jgi:transposase-like protein